VPLILLRHTRPDVAEGVCYGRTDLDLAGDFDAEALRIARDLPPVSRIVASPQRRALRLAEALAAWRGLALEVEPDLREMDFGHWELVPWSEIPRGELDAWAAEFLDARPHGGESVRTLAARVTTVLARTPPAEPPVLWVTHSGVIRAVCAHLGRHPHWETGVGFGGWLDLTGRAAETAGPPGVSAPPARTPASKDR
jgi:alpha-ribazole phosphatase